MSRSVVVSLLAVAAVAVWLATSTGATSAQNSIRVTLDGYTYNSTLSHSTTLPLGTTFALVCRVVGLPRGTPATYSWTCPGGPCNSRAVDSQHASRRLTAPNRLIVTAIHQQMDSGNYTCTVKVASRHDSLTGQFSLKVEGGVVLLSTHEVLANNTIVRDASTIQTQYGHEQLTDNTTGTIFCLGRERPAFHYKKQGSEIVEYAGSGEQPPIIQRRSESVAAVRLNSLTQTPNRKLCCRAGAAKTCVYIFLNDQKNLQIPNVKKTKRGNLKLASTTGHQSHVATIHHMDVGLTHTLATESSTLLSLMTLPAGVSYRVSVLAAKGGGTSTKPANLNIKGQGSPINAYGYGKPRSLTITRALPDGVELNWLPPKDMHTIRYQVTYSTEEDFNSASYSKPLESTGDTVYYNLTGLTKGRRHYIMVATLFTTRSNKTAISYAVETVSHYIPDSSHLTNQLSLAITTTLIVVLAIAVIVLVSILLRKRVKRKLLNHSKKANKASSPEQPGEVKVEGGELNIYEAVEMKETGSAYEDPLQEEDAPQATKPDSAPCVDSVEEEYTPMDFN